MKRSLLLTHVLIFLLLSHDGVCQPVVFKRIFDYQSHVVVRPRIDSLVTQSKSITISLDTMFLTGVTYDYYMCIQIQFLKWKPGERREDANTIQFGAVFKNTINSANEGERVCILENLRLVNTQSLQNVNLISIEAKLIKAPEQNSHITELVNTLLGVVIGDPGYFAFIEAMIAAASSDPENDEVLVFRSDFAVPLGTLEARQMTASQPQYILSNNGHLDIPFRGKVALPILKNTVAGGLVKLVSGITHTIAGIKVGEAKTLYDGEIVVSFSTDPNQIIPEDIQKKLEHLSDEIRTNDFQSTQALCTDISTAAEDAYYTKHQIDQNLKATIHYYVSMAKIYGQYLVEQANGFKSNIWYTQFSDLYMDMSSNASVPKFVLYGVRIYKVTDDRVAPIYVPYALDDLSASSFFMWQVKMHDQIARNRELESLAISGREEVPATAP